MVACSHKYPGFISKSAPQIRIPTNAFYCATCLYLYMFICCVQYSTGYLCFLKRRFTSEVIALFIVYTCRLFESCFKVYNKLMYFWHRIHVRPMLKPWSLEQPKEVAGGVRGKVGCAGIMTSSFPPPPSVHPCFLSRPR